MISQLNSTSDAGRPDEAYGSTWSRSLLEDYQDGRLTRRDALKRIAGVLGSLVIAESLLAACAPPGKTRATLQPTTPPTAPTLHLPCAYSYGNNCAFSTTHGDHLGLQRHHRAADDPAIEAGRTISRSRRYTARYLARPKGNGPFPAVLVCHENRV